jgi:hypothetical protein
MYPRYLPDFIIQSCVSIRTDLVNECSRVEEREVSQEEWTGGSRELGVNEVTEEWIELIGRSRDVDELRRIEGLSEGSVDFGHACNRGRIIEKSGSHQFKLVKDVGNLDSIVDVFGKEEPLEKKECF